MATADLREELECSICLNLFADPLTLSCGHHFCQGCIGSLLDTQEASGLYTCPECRLDYQERPVLQRNRKLANIVGLLCSTAPEMDRAETYCTYCIYSSVPAVKTCLHCEASLCDKHLRVHSKSEDHVLVEPTTLVENRRCSVHKQITGYYCCEDGACICASCYVIGEHRGHSVELLTEASEKKKVKLRSVLEKLEPKKDQTLERIQMLREHRSQMQQQASHTAKRVRDVFQYMRDQLEVREKQVLSEILRLDQHLSLTLSGLIEQLETQKAELSRKIQQIKELCNMVDPLTILQHLNSDETDFFGPKGINNSQGNRDEKILPVEFFEEEKILENLMAGLDDTVTGAKTWWLYGQENQGMQLDIQTAANYVALSEDMKSASWAGINQRRPQTPVRFQNPQVLSTNRFLSERNYLDVEVSESGGWSVGVAYASIAREGEQSWIGNNSSSWCLYRYNNMYSVRHNSQGTKLPHSPSCGRLRISLDHKGKCLSFYELSEPIRHLHTFRASFNEPLHVAVRVGWMGNAWVRIISNKAIQ
ncbi:E3 ubiquitin-protein ligase TRIM7 [Xenopus laevis]|uniref:E3 ubiquitin-protein ligase TRIM7 n=2 Tax=Xenopus laevis TaxID=8355 RepID=A0A1L8G099_XENLA|nr:E3 ubiquitin-protein ligase TRIM7 [Xenopus laevis]OCT77224.1 hypothetical protein XELAEV_18032422mg [Xenopus laevis]